MGPKRNRWSLFCRQTSALAALLGSFAACSSSQDKPTAAAPDTPPTALDPGKGEPDLSGTAPGSEKLASLQALFGSEADAASGITLLWQNEGISPEGAAKTTAAVVLQPPVLEPEWQVMTTVDADGNGKRDDLVWRNLKTGETKIWRMDGTAYSAEVPLTTVPLAYHLVGAGAFEADGLADDLVWRNPSTGAVVLWRMKGTELIASSVLGVVGAFYRLEAVGDFDGNGYADLLWRTPDGTQRFLWLMDATLTPPAMASVLFDFPEFADPAWQVIEVGDFDGQGRADDLLWQNAKEGSWKVSFVTDTKVVATVPLSVQPPSGTWQIAAVGDFDGQGKLNDLVWRLWNQTEACDGLDNNSNGGVDEGFATSTCGVGACQRTVSSCVNGQPSDAVCAPGAPVQEACGNGIDEDCDGQDLPCPTPPPSDLLPGVTAVDNCQFYSAVREKRCSGGGKCYDFVELYAPATTMTACREWCGQMYAQNPPVRGAGCVFSADGTSSSRDKSVLTCLETTLDNDYLGPCHRW